MDHYTDEEFDFVNVILRVPPLFIIDELFRIGFGLSSENVVLESTDHGFKLAKVPENTINTMISVTSNLFLIEPFTFGHLVYKIYFMIVLKFLCCCLGKIFIS